MPPKLKYSGGGSTRKSKSTGPKALTIKLLPTSWGSVDLKGLLSQLGRGLGPVFSYADAGLTWLGSSSSGCTILYFCALRITLLLT